MSIDSASPAFAAGLPNDRDQQVFVKTQRKIAATFLMAVGISIVIGLVSYSSVSRLRDDAARVAHTHEVIGALQTLLSTVTGAQTASRGYAITGS